MFGILLCFIGIDKASGLPAVWVPGANTCCARLGSFTKVLGFVLDRQGANLLKTTSGFPYDVRVLLGGMAKVEFFW